MSAFPTIQGAHWRAAMQRAKTEPNRVMEKIAQILQQSSGDGAGLRGRSDAGDARCSAASHFESGGVESPVVRMAARSPQTHGERAAAQTRNGVSGEDESKLKTMPCRREPQQIAGVAPGPLSSISDEPKEGSRHALNNTQHPAPSDYGVGSHDLTFAATAADA